MIARRFAWYFLAAIVALCVAATVTIETGNLYIQNSDTDAVKIRVRTAAAQSAPWIEFTETNALRFSIPATGLVPVDYGGTGTNTVAGVRSVLGIGDGATNSTPAEMRTYLELVDGVVTNTLVPIASGGSGAATVAAAKLAFGIQSGTNVLAADHTVTNTFSPAFSAAPIVTVTGWTQGPATNAFILSASTSNVIVCGTATDPIHWIAVGAP